MISIEQETTVAVKQVVIVHAGTLNAICEIWVSPARLATLNPQYEALDPYEYLTRINKEIRGKQ